MMFSDLRTLRWVLALTISAWLAAGLIASTSFAQQAAPAAPAATAPAAETPAAAAPPAPAPIAAQPVSLPNEVLEPITRLAKSIEGAEKAIQHLKELEEELSRLRNDVETILNDSTQTAEGLRPQLSEIRSLIEKLGPAPVKDAPAEALAIASERQRLNALAAAIDGAVKSTELTWFRARQLIEKITTMRHQIFQRNLFERRQSPLLPALWRDVGTRWIRRRSALRTASCRAFETALA